MAEWLDIRELARQGLSVSEIARRAGHDRKTVRKVLQECAPKTQRNYSLTKVSKLDPYREYLLQRVEQGCLNGAVLLEEIGRMGYTGKVSILRDFLRPVRRELLRKREATERFETGPGKQAQVDWAQFGQIWDGVEGRWRKLYGFLFTLGYSRAQYLEFTTSCDMEHFLHCHVGAFRSLGIPERVLYDNLKTGILGRRPDGTPIFPGRFLDFALYYGFSPQFCRPYRARTKGKVERSVSYVRQNFWVRVGSEVRAKGLDLVRLNQRAQEWTTNVANVRTHGTYGEPVSKRLAEEEPLLGKPAGRAQYDTDYQAIRRVGRDGRLSYRGQLYQVPVRYALSEVRVSERLEVLAGQAMGEVRIHSKEGQLLAAEVVSTALSCPSQLVRDQWSAETRADILNQLQTVYPDAPAVEKRDLGVYEELARDASIG